jgi:AmmeMemoRadiSam system protein B
MVGSSVDIRPSPLAGKWYPANPDALKTMLDTFLQAALPRQIDGTIHGLLAPHAGLQYSGPVAARAFALVKGLAFDTVVVIGPMHHLMPGHILTTAHTAYETPLGTVPVDQAALAAIGKTLHLDAIRNDPEHSVEIELPFLQHVLAPGFSLIPLMLRDQSVEQAQALGAALARVLQDRPVLLVASSDLSHFYKQDIAHRLDTKMLDCVAAMDAERIVEYNEHGKAFACGYGAIATVLNVLRIWQVNRAEIVGYATSGDVTGDLNRVVGYGAAAFWHVR